MKQESRLFEMIESGCELYSLTSKYISHFSEMEHARDLYILKCRLVFHALENILGESHY